MSFVSNGKAFATVVSASATLFASMAAFGADTAKKTCPTAIEQKRWSSLEDSLGKCNALVEGSYRGMGRHTHHTYNLHLRKYLDRSDKFVAVARDMDSGHSSIGFLVRKGVGSYAWYGLRVTSSAAVDYDFMDVALDRSPLFTFMLEPNAKGKVERMSAVSENPQAKVEAIDFNEARSPLLKSEMLPGRWEEDLNTLTVSPAGFANDSDVEQATASWLTKLLRNDPNGSSAQISYQAREEAIPGLFAFRQYAQAGYVRSTSQRITYVGVVLTRVRNWGAFDTKVPEILLFVVKENGFLGDGPLRLKYNE